MLLVSDSPKVIDVTVAVHGRRGETVTTQLSIQPQQKMAVDLRKLLVGAGSDVSGEFVEGSVGVSYAASGSRAVVGQVTISNPVLGLVHESEMVENDPGASDIPPVLNSLWWGLAAGRDAKFMVSNAGGDAVTADVYLDFAGERHASAPLAFIAHETKVISIRELLGKLDFSPAQAPEGGITILPRGPNPTLIASGMMSDPSTGFSTTLHFLLPQKQKTNALAASGVPIGPQAADSSFGKGGTFVPHVVMRNLLSSPQSGTVTVEYPSDQGTQQAVVGPLALGPLATQDVSLDSVVPQLPHPVPYSSVRIQYSGAAGSVVAEVASVDQEENLVVDSHLANEGDGWQGSGANPWHLDDQTESVLFLTNLSDKPTHLAVEVQAGGAPYYLPPVQLQPHETRAIDVRKLRDAQKADVKDHKIPAGATDGSISWNRLNDVAVAGRLVVINRATGVASNFDCCVCPCADNYVGLTVSPSSATLTVGSSASFTALAEYRNCCGIDYFCIVDAFWESSNTSVATVTAGTVTGKGYGTAYITATFTDCQWGLAGFARCDCTFVTFSGSATVNVTAPYPINFTQSGSTAGGGFLAFQYQWGSSTGNVADLQNCQVGEFLTYPGYVPGQQGLFLWPQQAWNSTTSNNPTEDYVPGNWPCSISLPAGCVIDQQFHGTFVTNPANAGFPANQTWQYKCPGVNNGNPVTLLGPLTIQRSVSCSGSTCTYTVTKGGASSSCIVGQNCN